MNGQGFFLVTGARGRLGLSTCKRLLGDGHRVVGVDVVPLIEGDSELQHEESYVHIAQDATSTEGIEQAMSSGIERFGPLVGAVHAAYPRTSDWGTHFENLNPQSLSENLSTQLGGAIIFSRAVVSAMRQGGRGSIVLVSSIQGIRAPRFEHYDGLPMYSPAEYAAIKSGVIGFSKWLAKYLAGDNIRVNCVSPGGIDADQPEEFKHRYRRDCLNKGLLDPDDVAGAISFLLTEDSRYMSGQNLIVDDGWSL